MSVMCGHLRHLFDQIPFNETFQNTLDVGVCNACVCC